MFKYDLVIRVNPINRGLKGVSAQLSYTSFNYVVIRAYELELGFFQLQLGLQLIFFS
jgi:hypothetical protein